MHEPITSEAADPHTGGGHHAQRQYSKSTYLWPLRYDSFEAFMPAVEEVWAATWARLQAGEPQAERTSEEESPLSPTPS